MYIYIIIRIIRIIIIIKIIRIIRIIIIIVTIKKYQLSTLNPVLNKPCHIGHETGFLISHVKSAIRLVS